MVSRTALTSLLLRQNVLDLQSPVSHIQYNKGESFIVIDRLCLFPLSDRAWTFLCSILAVLPLKVSQDWTLAAPRPLFPSFLGQGV